MKKIVIFSMILIIIVFEVSYLIIDSSKKTTYGAVLDEVLGSESVEEIRIYNIDSPEPPEPYEVFDTDTEILQRFTEKSTEMRLKKTSELPVPLYFL